MITRSSPSLLRYIHSNIEVRTSRWSISRFFAGPLWRKLNDEKAQAGALAARLVEPEEALRSAGKCIATFIAAIATPPIEVKSP